jgi:hypothetical protein
MHGGRLRFAFGVATALIVESACGRMAPGTGRSRLSPDSGEGPTAAMASPTGGRATRGSGSGGSTLAGSGGNPWSTGGAVGTGGSFGNVAGAGGHTGGTSVDAGHTGGASVDAEAGAGGSDGGGPRCDGRAVDFSTDPSHCGRCGHSCEGGACISGFCQPVVLAAHQDVPWRIALDESRVYWINTAEYSAAHDGTISSISKQGGDVTVLSTGLQGSNDIATDGNEVFFTDTGGCIDCVARVHKVPVAGGTTTLLATWMDDGFHVPYGITVVGRYVYWTNTYLGGGLQRLPTTGGTAYDLSIGFDYARTLASDATHAYFTSGWSPDLVRVSLPDGPTEVVTRLSGTAMSLSNTEAIAVDATHAYCVGDNGLFRVRLADGATDSISESLGRGIAVDDEYVYTANSYGGTIERRSLDGSSVALLATGRPHPTGLAVDGTSLYWSESENTANAGAIVKLVK